jgi:uncharacterized protein (TIGR02246 family)
VRPASIAIALLGLALALACAKDRQPPADDRSDPAVQQAAIRGLDAAWAKAVAAKNVDQAVSYYADSASLMLPGTPITTGKAAIRATWGMLLGQPGTTLTFAPITIDVSGDRAIEIGSYELTANDKSGKPQTSKAKYIVVWGKQADGNWKVLVDAPTTTQ